MMGAVTALRSILRRHVRRHLAAGRAGQDFLQIEVALLGEDQVRLVVQRDDGFARGIQICGRRQVDLVEHQEIGVADLGLVERPQHLAQPGELRHIDDRHHRPDLVAVAERRLGKRLDHLFRLGDPRGLDDHGIQVLLGVQFLDGVQQRALERAAKTPRGQLDHVDVLSLEDGAVDPDVAEFIDDDRHAALGAAFLQQAPRQGRLAGSEETEKQVDPHARRLQRPLSSIRLRVHRRPACPDRGRSWHRRRSPGTPDA